MRRLGYRQVQVLLDLCANSLAERRQQETERHRQIELLGTSDQRAMYARPFEIHPVARLGLANVAAHLVLALSRFSPLLHEISSSVQTEGVRAVDVESCHGVPSFWKGIHTHQSRAAA